MTAYCHPIHIIFGRETLTRQYEINSHFITYNFKWKNWHELQSCSRLCV